MVAPSWELLLRSLRRLVRFRQLAAPTQYIEAELVLARRFFAATGITGWVDWPADVRDVAIELGFLDPAVEASYREQIARAASLLPTASDLHRRIAAAVAVRDLNVVVSPSQVVVTGGVASEEERARLRDLLAAIAAERTDGLVLHERVVVGP